MLGERLAQLARSGARDVTLVAPFMKRDSLARVLDNISLDGPRLTCVTRWRPEEIVAGLSDPEIWPLLSGRGARLLLRDDLHAKAFIVDDRCLVGSANLTAAALGWSDSPNLELLIEMPRSTAEIAALEAAIDEQSVEVDDQLFQAVLEAVAALAALRSGRPPAPIEGSGAPADWLPLLRSPESLFDAYRGETSDLTTAARETAEADLVMLRIPAGLDRSTFDRTVAVRLLQVPMIAGVDKLVMRPRRFGEVREYLARHGKERYRDWESAWQTLMRWLRHFMPDRYVLSVPHISEILLRKDALDRMLRGS